MELFSIGDTVVSTSPGGTLLLLCIAGWVGGVWWKAIQNRRRTLRIYEEIERHFTRRHEGR